MPGPMKKGMLANPVGMGETCIGGGGMPARTVGMGLWEGSRRRWSATKPMNASLPALWWAQGTTSAESDRECRRLVNERVEPGERWLPDLSCIGPRPPLEKRARSKEARSMTRTL